jgi:cation diffusion facilitator CzcD-associated flavoprotein CzcO
VVIFRTGQVLVDPSHAELSEFLGASTRPASTTYDVAIVGAGPAGLAAAVSAASEGLATLVVEPELFGGQAGTSSLIRNYPGFPHGISGDDLAFRTFEQAWLFGTSFVFAQDELNDRADYDSTNVDLRGPHPETQHGGSTRRKWGGGFGCGAGAGPRWPGDAAGGRSTRSL